MWKSPSISESRSKHLFSILSQVSEVVPISSDSPLIGTYFNYIMFMVASRWAQLNIMLLLEREKKQSEPKYAQTKEAEMVTTSNLKGIHSMQVCNQQMSLYLEQLIQLFLQRCDNGCCSKLPPQGAHHPFNAAMGDY